MENCNCSHCYKEVCFHPSRGEGAGLGTMCDGCNFDEIANSESNIIQLEDTPVELSMLGIVNIMNKDS